MKHLFIESRQTIKKAWEVLLYGLIKEQNRKNEKADENQYFMILITMKMSHFREGFYWQQYK